MSGELLQREVLSRATKADSVVNCLGATIDHGRFPDGKPFAFSAFAGTYNRSGADAGPVCRMLHALGFQTTMSVWQLAGAS
jgi:hypothetical protein